jgi:FHS family L-fucose permease-like MFS transporter
MVKNEQSMRGNWVAISIIAGVFFIFGFVTWINGALIPFMKTISPIWSLRPPI